MTPALAVAGALAAGVAAAVAVVTLGTAPSPAPPAAAALLDRRRSPAVRVPRRAAVPVLDRWLAPRLDRAGWRETPERFILAAVGVGLTVAVVGAVLGWVIGDPATTAGLITGGAAGGIALSLRALVAAGDRRRERLLAELAPALDLVGIELSAGASPLVALGSVARRADGELARLLRGILAATAIGTDRGADAHLQELGERLDLPPLVAVATILATSRDYGSGVGQGIRAIAVDLRRSRRRELIASSRRALSRVLIPAAVGVLLPFMAVLLYPAVTALSASFR